MKGLWQSVLKKGQELGLVQSAHMLVIFMDDVAVCCTPIAAESEDATQAKYEAILRSRAGFSGLLEKDVPHVDRSVEISRNL